MKVRAGHYLLDTERRDVYKYLGKSFSLNKSLYLRKDGIYFLLDESGEDGPKAKVVEEKEVFRQYYRFFKEVLNYRWLFRQVFNKEWSMDLIKKPKSQSKKSSKKSIVKVAATS